MDPLDSIEIRLEPQTTSWMVNDTVRASLRGFDSQGASYPAGPVNWRSSDSTIVRIDTAGLAQARSPGTVEIVATVGHLADSLNITVSGTRHNRPITASELWPATGSPHLVSGRINAGGAGGVTLTIEAGALVVFEDSAGLSFGATAAGPGWLIAEGAASAPITMRGVDSTLVPGSWVGLTFRGRVSSTLRYVTLSGCGGSRNDEQPQACVVAGHRFLGSDPEVLMDHVTVDVALGTGIIFQGGSRFGAGSTTLSVRNVKGNVAIVPAGIAADFPLGGAYSANDVEQITLTGDTLRQSVTWSNAGPQWFLAGSVWIEGRDAPVLTIPAGVTIQSSGAGDLVVGNRAPGGLRIGTTGAAPVSLTGVGIAFWPQALPSTIQETTLENCAAETLYATACLVFLGNFFGTGPTPVLQDVTIRGATYHAGVAAVGGGCFGAGSNNVVITGTHGSPGSAIYVYESPAECIPPGTYLGNDLDAIWVYAATVRRNQTWHNRGVPYLVGALSVGHWVDPILTLEPGVELKFPPGAYLTVGQDAPGGLRALGLDGAPVVFSGQSEFPGGWMGIVIGAQADPSTLLDHVVVDYAGGDDGIAAAAIRLARDLGGVIQNSLLSRSYACGIARMGSDPWVTDFTAPQLGNTFAGNGGPDQCGP